MQQEAFGPGGKPEVPNELVPASTGLILSADGTVARIWRVVDVPAEPVEWLWPDKMPVGKVSLIVGDPGRGKSLICVDVAARVTTGADWPTGLTNTAGPRQALIVSAEDDVADTIRPRLEAAGADLSRVATMSEILTSAGKVGFELPRDTATLEAILAKMPSIRLLVIDPIMAFIGPGNTTNQGIRGVIAGLQALATARRFAVLCVTHLTKSPASSPIYRAMGSLGLVAAARAVHTCWPANQGRRHRKCRKPCSARGTFTH